MTGVDPLLRHVFHAEEWLRRARRDWRSGDGHAAVLRLMLAEAEIRHAREAGLEEGPSSLRLRGRGAGPLAPPMGGRGAGRRAAAAIAAAAVLAAGAAYTSIRALALTGGGAPHGTVIAHEAPAPPGNGADRTFVRLDSGQFLMAGQGQDRATGPSGGSLQLAVPVDLRTPSPTF
ncbi:MAG TPA: hypothetical protein VGZ23_15160 [bacterium]|nr:hypothetical protein [bacterium]